MTSDQGACGSRAIITVLGTDRPGIVAAVAGALSEREANILDISQTILQGIFTMTMLIDLGQAMSLRRPSACRSCCSARTSSGTCTVSRRQFERAGAPGPGRRSR